EYSHLQPASPILEATCVSILVVREDCGRHERVGTSLLDVAIDSLDECGHLRALEVGKLGGKHLRRREYIRLQSVLEFATLVGCELWFQPLAKVFERCAAVVKIGTGKTYVIEMQTIDWVMLQHVHPDVVDVIAHFRIRWSGVNTFQLAAIRLGPFDDLLTVSRIARRYVV